MSAAFSLRSLGLGFLSWLLPFAVSVVFFGPGGQLWLPQPLFKSLMVVIGGGIGLWLLLAAFRRQRLTIMSGLTTGIVWFVINIVLDIGILLPMSGMTLTLYIEDIGLRYLLLPLIALALGVQAERSRGEASGL